MKKLLLILVFVLFSFSIAYGEGELQGRQSIEIPMMANPAEEDYTGVWIPFLRYLHSFKDFVEVDEEHQSDYVLIQDKKVSAHLMGDLYDDLPYKFDEGAVVSVIHEGTKFQVDLTMRLYAKNLMLYSIGWDGEAKIEFLCYQKGGL